MAPTTPRKRKTRSKLTLPSVRSRRDTAHVAPSPLPTARDGQWPWHWLAWNGQHVRLAVIAILIVGAFFRSTGRNWDAMTGLHPDERFYSMMASEIQPNAPEVGYFDTARSTLNPSHRNGAFFVYGTLPLFAQRWVNRFRGENDSDHMLLSGRFLSALADLGTILLTFFLGRWYYGTVIGLGAAALYALAEMPIQLSHFFPVDPFVTFFTLLAFAALYQIARLSRERESGLRAYFAWSLGFGATAGLAGASKIYGALVVFCYLPAAWDFWQRRRPQTGAENVGLVFHCWLLVLAMAALFFRVAQPYAFVGPGFWDLSLSPKWLADLQQQYAFSTDFGSYPPTLQWIGRGPTFALSNLLRWGFAPFGGLLGIVGLVWMGTRIFRRRESIHLPHWSWAVGYFTIFGLITRTPMQRYLLPIYPWLAIAGAWACGELWLRANRETDAARAERYRRGIFVGVIGLLFTSLLGAFAVSSIYRQPMTRLAASEWILHNAPGPINVGIETMGGTRQLPLAFPYAGQLTLDHPARTTFVAHTAGEAKTISLPHLLPAGSTGEVTFTVTLSDNEQKDSRATSSLTLKVPAEQRLDFPLQPALRIQRGHFYQVEIAIDKPVLVFHLEGTRIAHETGWDDQLPTRWSGVEDIGPIDPFGGVYPTDLDLDAYSPDTHQKIERLAQVMERAEMLTLSSQRQWASLSRLPTKFPVMTRFYQKLIGCPSEAQILDCYARPQHFELHPELGYKLVMDFRSFPSLGPVQFVDSLVEESLTVYDHPPVMIFQNTEHLPLARLRDRLDGNVVP